MITRQPVSSPSDPLSGHRQLVSSRCDPVAALQPVILITPEQRIEVTLPVFDRLSNATTTEGQQATPIKTLLVFTKSHAVKSALQELRPHLDKHTRIILFQNGLGSQTGVVEDYLENPVFAAVTTEGANKTAPHTVVHAGIGSTSIGALNARAAADPAILAECVEQLTKSGLSVSRSGDIRELLWHKLAINCAINPFTALFNCRNGQVAGHPDFLAVWPALLSELEAMLQQAGYPVAAAELENRIFTVMEKTRDNISSMLQDVRNHRMTENNDINGFAWRYLAGHRLPHAVNRSLWEKVEALQPLP